MSPQTEPSSPSEAYHPICGRRVWTGTQLSAAEGWKVRLDNPVLTELDRCVEAFRRSGAPLGALLRGEADERAFPPLPAFADTACALASELRDGLGFVLLQGFPVDRYDGEERTVAYARLCSYFGHPLPQDRNGSLTYSVRNEGYDLSQHGAQGVNGAKSTARLHFHTDSAPAYGGYTPHTVALLCLRTAQSGGESLLVNGNAIFNAMLAEQPAALARAFRPFHFDRRSESGPGEAPTLEAPLFEQREELLVRFNYFYLAMGHDAAGVPLTPADRAPIQFIRQAAERDGMAFPMSLAPGDIQLINNRWVLHARTAFQDPPPPAEGRHLLRLWLRDHA